MSEHSGLSILDSADAQSPTFPQVRRGGYDTDAVDAFVRSTRAELDSRKNDLDEEQSRAITLQTELNQSRHTVESLQEKLEEVGNPSYKGLGTHAAQLLELAEQEAREVRESAQQEAEDLRAEARQNIEAEHAKAAKQIDDMRVNTMADLESRRTELLDSAERQHRSEEHTSELQSRGHLVCRLLLEK